MFSKIIHRPVLAIVLSIVIVFIGMLAIKQLFSDGHILKDVYVAETRLLYGKAKALRT